MIQKQKNRTYLRSYLDIRSIQIKHVIRKQDFKKLACCKHFSLYVLNFNNTRSFLLVNLNFSQLCLLCLLFRGKIKKNVAKYANVSCHLNFVKQFIITIFNSCVKVHVLLPVLELWDNCTTTGPFL